MKKINLVILDRDGVLNEDSPDYIKSPEELIMIPNARPAVAKLNAAGIKVAIATNQSGVGRGYFDLETLEMMHEKLRRELAAYQGYYDALFFCPDHPDKATDRRKPAPGMIHEALKKFGMRGSQTIVIGDSLRDLQAGQAAGCHVALVRTGKGKATEEKGLPPELEGTPVFNDLLGAVNEILEHNNSEEKQSNPGIAERDLRSQKH